MRWARPRAASPSCNVCDLALLPQGRGRLRGAPTGAGRGPARRTLGEQLVWREVVSPGLTGVLECAEQGRRGAGGMTSRTGERAQGGAGRAIWRASADGPLRAAWRRRQSHRHREPFGCETRRPDWLQPWKAEAAGGELGVTRQMQLLNGTARGGGPGRGRSPGRAVGPLCTPVRPGWPAHLRTEVCRGLLGLGLRRLRPCHGASSPPLCSPGFPCTRGDTVAGVQGGREPGDAARSESNN